MQWHSGKQQSYRPRRLVGVHCVLPFNRHHLLLFAGQLSSDHMALLPPAPWDRSLTHEGTHQPASTNHSTTSAPTSLFHPYHLLFHPTHQKPTSTPDTSSLVCPRHLSSAQTCYLHTLVMSGSSAAKRFNDNAPNNTPSQPQDVTVYYPLFSNTREQPCMTCGILSSWSVSRKQGSQEEHGIGSMHLSVNDVVSAQYRATTTPTGNHCTMEYHKELY